MSAAKWSAIVLVAAFSFAARAAEPAKPAILDPKDAGPDFNVQGEYTGQITAADGAKSPLAAQVVALGNGAFLAVLLPGGLPGDGWNGQDRIELSGKTEADATTFAGNGYTASIAAEAITGQTDKKAKLELKKVFRRSPTLGAKPPAGAIVLFDAQTTDELDKPRVDERKLLFAGTSTKRNFANFTLHVEFILPYMPDSAQQGRANSGLYLQKRYEVQILDSFAAKLDSGQCASIYKQRQPSLNMCYPPLSWQTYDMDFRQPEWNAAGLKTSNARITLKHNGVVVHDNVQITNKTGAGSPEGPLPGPINFQYHGNPVFFRNIWIVQPK